MKLGTRTTCFLSLLLWSWGCTDQGNPPSAPVHYDTYAYRATTDSGRVLVQGWFTLIADESTSVHGEWNFTAVAETTGFGRQFGTSTLTGAKRGSQLDLNLNPAYADNNVMLSGSSNDSGYAGTWTWITFAGPTARGPFTATQR